MRVIIQRVDEASVEVDKKITGEIKKGLMILVGFKNEDTHEIIDKMIDKIIHLRIFEDENEKLNLSLLDVGGSILSVSQFTLYADCKKGRRPSFINAAKGDVSLPLYEYFNEKMMSSNVQVETGIFGAMMNVSLINSGPTTIYIDSDEIF